MGGQPGPLRTPELLKLDRRLLAVVVHSPRKLDPSLGTKERPDPSLGTEERPWAGDGAAAASTEEPPELVCVGPARVALLVVVVVGCCCPCECACACVREALAERAGRSSWLIWPWAMMSANLPPWLRSRPSRLSRPSVPDLSLALSCPAVTASLLLVLFVTSRSDREFPLSIMASLLLVLPGACACVRETLAACAAESSALRSERKGRCSWLIWPWPMMRANLSPRSRSRLTGRSRLSRRSRPSFPYRELPVTASLLLVPCAVAW